MGGHLIKDEIIYNNDMINLVLENVNYGSVWKSIRSVSKNIYYLSIKYQRGKLIELGNPILSLMYIYPRDNWSIKYLINESIITINFIKLTYNKISWTKRMISESSNITIDDILKSDPESIDWHKISMNPSIKVSDMLKYDYLPWDYGMASENTSIRSEDIRNNLDKNWLHWKIYTNTSISIDDLFTIINLYEEEYFFTLRNFSTTTYWWNNKSTTYKDIIKYSNKEFINRNSSEFVRVILLDENILQLYIDRNSNIGAHEINKQSITPNIIKNNPQLNWDYIGIDYSKFTVEEVINIPFINEVDVQRILDHPDFTIDYFFKHFDVNTFDEWFILSKSPWLTFDIVLEYKNTISWDHEGLSMNPNVTVDILEDSDFSWIKWDYYELSRYAQLNWVYILENSDKDWNMNGLANNKSLRI